MGRFKQNKLLDEIPDPLNDSTPQSEGFFIPNREVHAAFRIGARRRIVERAGSRCELTGVEYLPLQAAHRNHNKRNPNYNNPDNGLLVTDIMHLAHHFMHIPIPEQIGLNYHANNWAVDMQFRGVATRKVVAGEWDKGVFELEDLEFLQFLHAELHLYVKLWDGWYERNGVEA